MFAKIVPSIFQSFSKGINQSLAVVPVWNPWNLIFTRNRMRYHFPHPNERKRIKKHGWLARLATPSGRKILQRRILKGKHVLSH
ncbi:hypothetical protein PUN28_006294 [Cardiocondyla obscurior]|uniref:Large ribosomal subunit protein bL34m n=1 Tax=Cardiocondyla obscurior TaxID=286306 RepID=A0AAW2GCW0_9HYME